MAYRLGKAFRKFMIKEDTERQEMQLKENLFDKKILDDVEVLEDIPYDVEVEDFHLFDINYSKSIKGKVRPVIIDFHGGAYYHGTKMINKYYVKYIASYSKYYVVNANYRLIDKGVTIFDQLIDTLRLVEYIYSNAEKYNFDKKNIFITGDSAGAHIVGMLINAINNKEYREKLGVTINDEIKINAVGLTCAVYNFDGFKEKWFLKPFFKDIIDRKFKSSEKTDLIDVMKYYTHKCPVFINSAYGDFLKEGSLKAYEEFSKRGVDVEMSFWDSSIVEGRKLEHVYNILFPYYEESITTNKTFCDFIRKYVVD